MPDVAKRLTELVAALVEHQAKKHLGEEGLAIVAGTATELLGEGAADTARGRRKASAKVRQLLAAFRDADACFARDCGDHRFRQAIRSKPLAGLSALETLAAALPATLDDASLLAALRGRFRDEWPGLASESEVEQAALVYLGCLDRALAIRCGQVLPVLFRKLERLGHRVEAMAPEPRLDVPSFPVTETTRLHFAARRVPFLGRAAEVNALDRFLRAPAAFAWWMVAGPAGLGKSRLALELCRSRRPVWRAGFLGQDHGIEQWSRWEPRKPTLMVVDYASARPDEVQTVLAALASRAEPPKAPVRILLLEREAVGLWWDRLRGTGRTRHLLDSARFGEPLTLGPLSREDLWATMAFILTEAGMAPPPDREHVLDALAAIDPRGRPLFAALVADALRAGRDLRAWDRTRLLEDVLEREERDFWRRGAVGERDRNLLALATVAGGLPLDVLARDLDVPLPSPADYDPERYRLMSGRPATEFLAPLEPDIVGEFFVLEHLRPGHALDADRARALARAAWQVAPAEAGVFLTRAAQDFLTHPTLRLLSEPAAVRDSRQRRHWAGLAVSLVVLLLREGDADAAHGRYDELTAMARSFPEEAGPVLGRARALFNLVTACGERDDLETAIAFYNELADLADLYPGEAGLRVDQVQAAANLITDLGRHDRLETAVELHVQSSAICVIHPDDPAIRQAWAYGAVNLTRVCSDAGQVEPIRVVHRELVALAEAHPGEPALRERVAKAAVNLVRSLLRAGAAAEAEAVHADLAALAARCPDQAEIRVQLGHSALGLVGLHAARGARATAVAFQTELRDLAGRHPGERDLTVQLARAFAPLIICADRAGDPESAERLGAEVEALGRTDPRDAAMRQAVAAALAELVVAAGRHRGPVPARDVYRRLAALDEGRPSLPVTHERARAVFNLATALAQQGELGPAHEVYGEFPEITIAFREEPSLREYQAKTAFNLCDGSLRNDRLDDAAGYYADLAALVGAHPDEAALRLQQAKGALNLETAYARRGDNEAASGILGDLSCLAAAHPDDHAVQLIHADAAVNVVMRRLQEGDVQEAAAIASAVAHILRSPVYRNHVERQFGASAAESFTLLDALIDRAC